MDKSETVELVIEGQKERKSVAIFNAIYESSRTRGIVQL